MKAKCSNCKFFIENPTETTGECHRYPPMPVYIGEIRTLAVKSCYSQVTKEDWCGEYIFILKKERLF